MRRVCAAVVIFAACATAACSAALAQQTAPIELPGIVVTETQRRAKPQSMATTVVTARRREEPAQEVPFGLNVGTGQDLSDRRITDAETLAREVPNVSFTAFGDPRQSFYAIRGIGPVTFPVGHDDTSVVTYVDGVPQPFFGSDLRLFDIERVEVLRGPQGTLFGRNAQAGAVNITTRQPTDRFEAEATTEFGTHGYYRAEGVVSGPFNPFISGRLAGQITGLNGTITNIATDEDTGGADSGALRGTFLIKPSDATRISLSLFGQKDRGNPAYNVLRDNPGYPAVSLDPENKAERAVVGSALTVTHSLDGMILTSSTGFNYLDYDLFTNNVEGIAFSRLFGLPIGFFQPNFGTDISDWHEKEVAVSQEFRLSSKPGAPVSWVAGINVHYSDFSLKYTDFSSFFPVQNGWRQNEYETMSYAGFGEVTVPIAPKLSATFGLRYTHDTKDFKGTFRGNGFPGTVAFFEESGSRDYDLLTGRASLSYALTTTSSIYSTIGRGAKSDGFPRFTNNAALGIADAPYLEATSWTYEVGSKNTFFGGRGFINVAAFYNDVKDEHLLAIDPLSLQSISINVDTRSYGAEIETGYDFGGGFSALASLGYTHAEIRNVTDPIALMADAQDGNPVPNVPTVNTSLTLRYRDSAEWLGLPSAKLFGFVTHQYVAARAVDVGNHFDLDAYHLVSAKLGLEFEKYDIYAFANDLLDERPQLSGGYFGPGADTVYVSPGRIIGVGAKVRY